MKVIVIGATGTIGSAVVRVLEENHHDVVRASRQGPVKVNMTDSASIDALFASVPDINAVVCCAASAALTPLDSPCDSDFLAGLPGKLLGQVTLVRRALNYLRDDGSITLTSGRFKGPIPGSSFGALVNAGLEAFVQAAAREMPRGLRLNVVSPGWVKETLVGLGMDTTDGTAASHVARTYLAAIEGKMQGR